MTSIPEDISSLLWKSDPAVRRAALIGSESKSSSDTNKSNGTTASNGGQGRRAAASNTLRSLAQIISIAIIIIITNEMNGSPLKLKRLIFENVIGESNVAVHSTLNSISFIAEEMGGCVHINGWFYWNYSGASVWSMLSGPLLHRVHFHEIQPLTKYGMTRYEMENVTLCRAGLYVLDVRVDWVSRESTVNCKFNNTQIKLAPVRGQNETHFASFLLESTAPHGSSTATIHKHANSNTNHAINNNVVSIKESNITLRGLKNTKNDKEKKLKGGEKKKDDKNSDKEVDEELEQDKGSKKNVSDDDNAGGEVEDSVEVEENEAVPKSKSKSADNKKGSNKSNDKNNKKSNDKKSKGKDEDAAEVDADAEEEVEAEGEGDKDGALETAEKSSDNVDEEDLDNKKSGAGEWVWSEMGHCVPREACLPVEHIIIQNLYEQNRLALGGLGGKYSRLGNCIAAILKEEQNNGTHSLQCNFQSENEMEIKKGWVWIPANRSDIASPRAITQGLNHIRSWGESKGISGSRFWLHWVGDSIDVRGPINVLLNLLDNLQFSLMAGKATRKTLCFDGDMVKRATFACGTAMMKLE